MGVMRTHPCFCDCTVPVGDRSRVLARPYRSLSQPAELFFIKPRAGSIVPDTPVSMHVERHPLCTQARLCDVRKLRGLPHLRRFPASLQNSNSRARTRALSSNREAPVAANGISPNGFPHGGVSSSETQHLSGEHQWSIRDSASLYGINGWGSQYFGISGDGHAVVRPDGTPEGEVDLVRLVQQLQSTGAVQLPFIARFPDIIGQRIQQLNDCFHAAIERYSFKGSYRGVFPVKCNRDWRIMQSVVRYGAPYHFGLEAGSKPELLLAIAALLESPEALLICNGYKDRAYVETALLARQLRVNTVIVLEQVEELDVVIRASRALRVTPVLGVRAKLSTRAQGHWADTSGDRGKFGLNATQLLQVVSELTKAGMLDSLRLLHFHFGSQVSDIAVIKEAMREGSHIYAELCLLGAKMGHIDVGGGLGVDYDGTQSTGGASINYSMQNYANDVVAAVMDACRLKGVSHPIITSESGRALASHQSVLIFNVRNATSFSEADAQQQLAFFSSQASCASEENPQGARRSAEATGVMTSSALQGSRSGQEGTVGDYLLRTFQEVYDSMDESNFQESYNDAKQFKAEAAALFKLGCLSLTQRAHAEALFLALCHRVLRLSTGGSSKTSGNISSSELDELRQSLASMYHCNLSIFQSVPDSWAINQLFPIMPLSRLDEEPTEEATLADLTCDSDGKIARFVSSDGHPQATLKLHKLRQGESYYLGLFLGGVYQEAMGNSHNLFGSVSTVYVGKSSEILASSMKGTEGRLQPNVASARSAESTDSCEVVSQVILGETVDEVLRSAEAHVEYVQQVLGDAVGEALKQECISEQQQKAFRKCFVDAFQSYTYLDD